MDNGILFCIVDWGFWLVVLALYSTHIAKTEDSFNVIKISVWVDQVAVSQSKSHKIYFTHCLLHFRYLLLSFFWSSSQSCSHISHPFRTNSLV